MKKGLREIKRAWGSGFLISGSRIWGSGLSVQGRFMVYRLWCVAYGLCFVVYGSKFTVEGVAGEVTGVFRRAAQTKNPPAFSPG